MSAILEALHEQRLKAVTAAREILTRANTGAEGPVFSPEDEAAFTHANDDIDRLGAEINRIAAAENRATVAEAAALQVGGPVTSQASGGPAVDPATRDNEALRALVRGEQRVVEFRDLTKGTTTEGGFTVPTGFYAQLQEHLIENSAIRQTNATVITTDSGDDLQVPKTTTHPTAILIAEGAAITESDAAFGQVTLGAYKYGFITQISSELEQDTGVDLVGYLARIGGQALADGAGAHFITGTGTGQPNGVVTASTLGVTGATGTAGVFTADNLIELYYAVIAGYRRRGSWLMSDAGIRNARKLKGSDNNYLWQPGLQVGEPDLLLGRPVFSDTNIADPALSAKSVVFGDLSTYFIRDVRGVRVERSADYAFNADLATWRILARTDGDLVDLTGSVKHFIGGAT